MLEATITLVVRDDVFQNLYGNQWDMIERRGVR